MQAQTFSSQPAPQVSGSVQDPQLTVRGCRHLSFTVTLPQSKP